MLLAQPQVAGLEAVTTTFLREARESALGHFEGQRLRSDDVSNVLSGDTRTVQRIVEPRPGSPGCSGTIVAHISGPAFAAWVAMAPGHPSQREAHVLDQLQLVLQDLADHDVHSCLALTESQCEIYDLDLVQLVAESLERTSFSQLQRPADINWEGTLVKSLQPATLVLVVSIDL
jgi:hypothetical protein